MINKTTFASTIASLGLVLAIFSGKTVAQMPHNMDEMQSSQNQPTGQFQRLEQPLVNKIGVTLGGLGLIGLELWWFLLSKPKSRQATVRGNLQEETVTVDGTKQAK